MANLNVVPADVADYGTAHTKTASSVHTAANPPTPASTSMPSAFGPVGAVFTAAITAFDTALRTSGTELAADYDHMATSLHTTAATYTTTDDTNGARFHDPTVQLVSTPGAGPGNQVETPELIVPPAGPGPNAGPRVPDSIIGTPPRLI